MQRKTKHHFAVRHIRHPEDVLPVHQALLLTILVRGKAMEILAPSTDIFRRTSLYARWFAPWSLLWPGSGERRKRLAGLNLEPTSSCDLGQVLCAVQRQLDRGSVIHGVSVPEGRWHHVKVPALQESGLTPMARLITSWSAWSIEATDSIKA